MKGIELKVARVQLGLSQYGLGLKLGIHPARLSEMETGKRPVPEVIAERMHLELANAKGLEEREEVRM